MTTTVWFYLFYC